MANREALRDLQNRLAERMQAARTQARGTAWLAVECRGVGLLLPLKEAGEIFPLVPLLAVPHTLNWFAGVANLRGGLYGVVDLSTFLGLGARAGAEAQRDQARLVALNSAIGLNCALLVDRLAGLRNAEQLLPDTNPAADVKPAFAGQRFRDADGRAWQEILLGELASHDQFLSIVG